MASKNFSKKCSVQIKRTKETQSKLAEKLQLDLERDLLRLFQSSLFCDIKFTVNTASIFTHSCILKTRAYKFYKFIYNEFEVLIQNGISIFNLYNASFSYLEAFIQNIYSNIHSSKAEESIIKHLHTIKISLKKDSTENNSYLQIESTVSPDSDLFFTPRCSPSEIQKPFASSELNIKDNNVVSYYKIVSVDDIPVDDKLEESRTVENYKKEEKNLLEQELAEQDELLLSFKTILTKKNKTGTNSLFHLNSSQSTKKAKPKLTRKLETNSASHEIRDKAKNKLPSWKTDSGIEPHNPIDKPEIIRSIKKNRYIKFKEKFCNSKTNIETENFLYSSDMDVSVTGADSGLENSSTCLPETSPRDNTMSETSGVDLTESTINDDIPHEEIILTKLVSSTRSSLSSENETWDGKDDHQITALSDSNVDSLNKNKKGADQNLADIDSNNKNNLNIDELNRLDEMEKNIRSCEIFLYMERNDSSFHQSHKWKNIMGNNNFEQNKISTKCLSDSAYNATITNDVNEIAEKPIISCAPQLLLCNNTNHIKLNNFTGKDDSSLERLNESKSLDKNYLYNNKISLGCESEKSYTEPQNVECDEIASNPKFQILEFPENVCDLNLKRGEVEDSRTPPCTPKKLKVENVEFESNEETKYPEIKSSNNRENSSMGGNNYFIDASSLLDEDEIISPPISLINFKCVQHPNEVDVKSKNGDGEEMKSSKTVITNFYNTLDEFEEKEKSLDMPMKEREQGELIFRNFIPHFSKHEVEENNILDDERFRKQSVESKNSVSLEDESEQVVPSADVSHCSYECRSMEILDNSQIAPPSINSVETHFFEPFKEEERYQPKIFNGENVVCENDSNTFSEPSINSNSEYCVENYDNFFNDESTLRLDSEFPPINSEKMDYNFYENGENNSLCRSQGEAWVVEFENDKKQKSKPLASFDLGLKTEMEKESKNEKNACTSLKTNQGIVKSGPLTEFSSDFNETKGDKNKDNFKSQLRAFPVEKSSSFGYFLDFGKECDSDISEERDKKVETDMEKKNNMFSMFIDIDGNTKPSISKKPKQILDKQKTFDKSFAESQNNILLSGSEVSEHQEEMKKSFYMFIESDSPKTKRKSISKKSVKSSVELVSLENSIVKPYPKNQNLFAKEYVKETDSKLEIKTDEEYSSKESSLPHMENGFEKTRSNHEKHSLTSFKLPEVECNVKESKKTVWSGSAVSSNEKSSESWLKSKDVFINYTSKNGSEERKTNEEKLVREEPQIKKESTFTMDEYKSKYKDKPSVKSFAEESNKEYERNLKTAFNHKETDCFVKLSDMDCSGSQSLKKNDERMTQSIYEKSSKKEIINGENLSRSIGSDTKKCDISNLYVNRSLTRLFPNLSVHSLASLSRPEEDKIGKEPNYIQRSEHSEISNSLQSSVEPSPLEISTSETEMSGYGGASSRLGRDLLRMFLEEIGPDVTIEVNGRRIKAHKCILSSRCQHFAALLSGGRVESAGNFISLQGFSYKAVHFALRYIYSGDSQIPESLNIVELATLADTLCLDGLQEIISYNLKVKYCHSFHVPCSICSVGVIDCLSIANSYGLDDLYRKCLKWITKYFVKLWPTKSFGSLPKELLEKCYQHYVVHMTVDNVLDTIVGIDKVRGSLPNVRWAESVSRLVKKIQDATIRFMADHFSSVLTSDRFLALGKGDGWDIGRVEDSFVDTVKYLSPEQACWSHAQLHGILSEATKPEPPQEMNWNKDFLKLLQLLAELVKNSLIKQAPRATKLKAWKQLEPELKNQIQEEACLVLPEENSNLSQRRPNYFKRNINYANSKQNYTSKTFDSRQIKLAISQQANKNSNVHRPLSLQIDQRSKKDSRFVPLRQSASTSSVRKSEPIGGIRKTQSRSQILGSTMSEPKKTLNPRYSEVKSRYLEPKSPQKIASEKCDSNSSYRRNFKQISSSGSPRNGSPALKPVNLKNPGYQQKKPNSNNNRSARSLASRSDSTTFVDSKQDKSSVSTRSDTPSAKMLNRLTVEENISTDSLCTDSLKSEKDATINQKSNDAYFKTKGKENLIGTRNPSISATGYKSKSTTNSPTTRRLNFENKSSSTAKSHSKPVQNFIISNSRLSYDVRPHTAKKLTNGKVISSSNGKGCAIRPNMSSSNKTQKNYCKSNQNSVNGNLMRKEEVDSENNEKLEKGSSETPALSRSGTFLKGEPTILKKLQAE